MPRKPTLSPSKISTYLACPSKYKWTYIDERGKWYLRSHHYYSFGTTLHRVLQRFHDEQDQGVETVQQAVVAVEESWIDAGYRSSAEMEEAMGLGKEIVATYVEQTIQSPSDGRVLLVEKQLRMDLGPFVLIGRLDRVDEYPDGTLEIIDYKSQRKNLTDEDVATDLAMNCYQLLVRHHYPDRPVRASIIALQAMKKCTAQLTDEEADRLRTDLLTLGEEILNRDYEMLEPTPKPLCLDCDFLALCSKHPEFDASALEAYRAIEE